MPKRLQKEFDKLKKDIVLLADLAKASVNKAIQAVELRSSDLAKEVIKEDDVIDTKEIEIEEECLKILALYQPVASDLRFVITILKINNDLERVGDLAGNIAQKAIWLKKRPKIETPFDLAKMEQRVQVMLEQCIQAFLNLDIELAKKVYIADDEVDNIHRGAYEAVRKAMHANPENIDMLIDLLSVSRNLERIGDYATNIAEDVFYLVEGEIVRHKPVVERKQSSSRLL